MTLGSKVKKVATGLPLNTPRIGEVLIFYRHIAHVTPKKLRKVVLFKR